MKFFFPHTFYGAGTILGRLAADDYDLLIRKVIGDHAVKPMDDTEKLSLLSFIIALKEGCKSLDLTASVTSTDKIVHEILSKEDVERERIRELGSELSGRINDEMSGACFLALDSREADYYKNPRIGWSLVEDRFPESIYDIEEAGKCLALNRGTACVFHLMRLMEIGLKSTAKVVGIDYAPSWESYIKQMNNLLAQDWKDKSDILKRNEEYIREVLGFLVVVKMAWRNPTIHVRRNYTPEEAGDVYGAVKTYMCYLCKLPIEKRI